MNEVITQRALGLLFGLALTACGGEPTPSEPASPVEAPTPTPTPEAEPTPPPAEPPPAEAEPPAPGEAPPPPSATDASALGAASRAFGADVLGALAGQQEGSFAVSPASLLIALGMTAEGARGETRTQMITTLHADALGDRLTPALGGQLAAWRSVSGVELAVANRLYGEHTYTFEEPFLATTRDVFGAPLERVDFQGNAEGARGVINGWVAQQTHDRIAEILPPRSLDPMTRLVLVNALYFRGDWQVQFDPARTEDDFFRPDGGADRVACRMMHRRGRALYGSTDDALVLELPYAGEQLSMLFVLPRGERTLADLVTGIDGARIEAWSSAVSSRSEVDVQIPRFRVEQSEPLAMKQMLLDLGMPLAFDRMGADFSGIGNPADARERLYVYQVFHRVFVEVEETGTEAAASTAVVMRARGGGPAGGPATPVFRADRPFLFAIRDRASGMLLFLGRVSRP